MSETEIPINVFVRCGERYQPPADDEPWRVVTLPAELSPSHVKEAVAQVRGLLRGCRTARLLIAGPVVLGAALGQGLAHDPVAVDYVQLNQMKKQFEVWVSNRENL